MDNIELIILFSVKDVMFCCYSCIRPMKKMRPKGTTKADTTGPPKPLRIIKIQCRRRSFRNFSGASSSPQGLLLRSIYEQRTKPIVSAKGRGWNGHRFLCVPHRSWGFGVSGNEMSKWLKRSSSRSGRTSSSSSTRKSSGSSEKGLVSYQQGSHCSALSVGMCL